MDSEAEKDIRGGEWDPANPFLGLRTWDEYMALALKEAEKAEEAGEVPVGAVLVDKRSGRVIARAHNQRELLRDPTAHAEILAITQGAAYYDSWRLSHAILVITLEPCLMCAGAVVQARIPLVVYGADDPKAGAYRSAHSVLVDSKNNHRPEVVPGILAAPCGEILKRFFLRKRSSGRTSPGEEG